MMESSLIAPLRNGGSIRRGVRNQKAICMLSVLAVLLAWFSSTDFEQPLILTSFIITAYGQQGTPSPQGSTPFLEWYQSQGDIQQTSNPLSVQITSPEKGQQVPAGQGLIVSGVSSDNSTSECKVSVIVNGVKPYQPTTASGTGGINDYSKWSFIIPPAYTTIKEGPDNKITSKLECTPSLTKWYSVNVTGIGATAPLDRAGTEIQRPLPLPVSPFASEDNIPDSSPPPSGPNTGTSTETVAGPTSPSLLISVNTPPNPATVGDDETLEATVLDSASHLQVNNAILELVVTDSAGNPIDESSDNDGDLSYTLDEAADGDSAPSGRFTATFRASADGYVPITDAVPFTLIAETDDAENLGPLSGEEADSDSDEDSSDNDAAGSLFDEDSDSDEDSSDNDTGELFE
jgi:hypothetical protein